MRAEEKECGERVLPTTCRVCDDEESTVFLHNFDIFLPQGKVGKNGLNMLYFYSLLSIFNIDKS